jgi:hypothetical protein
LFVLGSVEWYVCWVDIIFYYICQFLFFKCFLKTQVEFFIYLIFFSIVISVKGIKFLLRNQTLCLTFLDILKINIYWILKVVFTTLDNTIQEFYYKIFNYNYISQINLVQILIHIFLVFFSRVVLVSINFIKLEGEKQPTLGSFG